MSYPADLDSLLLALVEKLPRVDAVFTSGDRERWLATMDAALQLLYPPEWTPDARRRAKEARSEVGLTLTTEDIADAAMTLARARAGEADDPTWRELRHKVRRMSKEEAAAFFPTVSSPNGVIIGGALHEPVLVVPPPEAMERHVLSTMDEYAAHLRQATEEAPSSTTSADAVDDDGSSTGAPMTTGAEPADATSSPETPVASPPESAPGSRSTVVTAPSTPSPASTDAAPARAKSDTARRHFTADQRGAIIKRAVREGVTAVADDTSIHRSTIDRWMREMPVAVATFTTEWQQEQAEALAEGEPTVAQLEAERDKPVPPRVQWPTAPIERRPVDPERVRRQQADQA